MEDETYRSLLQVAHDLVLKPPIVPALVAPAETPMLVRCLDDELVKLQSTGQLLLPNLREYTDTIAVFSDYGGEHQGSRYSTYSFLFASWDARSLALESMREVRKAHGLMDPYREFQFKEPVSRQAAGIATPYRVPACPAPPRNNRWSTQNSSVRLADQGKSPGIRRKTVSGLPASGDRG
jgi:hypothetical protein